MHRLAKLDEAPTKGYLGSIDPHSPNYIPAQSSNQSISLANSTRVPHPHQLTKSHALRSLSEDDLGGSPEIGEWIEPTEEELPPVLRQRTTSHQWTEENARAGAIFPVRPNAELMMRAAAASAANPDAPSDLTLARAASELPPLVSLLAPDQSPEADKLPPRILSSYLLKQGKARKKWSRRYFTLLPRQFLLIYSKRSKEDQRRDRDPEQQALREREIKDREKAMEKAKERREKLAKEKAKAKEKAREVAMAERKKRREAAAKAGVAPPPDSEPEDDAAEQAESTDEEEEDDPATAAQGVVFGDDSTVPSKRRSGAGEDGGDSDAAADEDAADEDGLEAEEGGDDIVQISLRKFRLDPDGNLGLTIIVPLHAGSTDGVACDDAGQPLSTASSSGSASSLALLGGGVQADEKRIELRAESKKIAGLWLVELRRLQYQIYCVTQYANILSRNKVYTQQGRFELIQDPKPFLPVHLAASIAAGAATAERSNVASSAADKKPSALSLFTSALTGDDRRCCAKCKSAFGLLRKTIVCIDCHNRFCNRPSCVMPLLHNNEEDTFSVATLAADHSSLNGSALSSEKARRAKKAQQKGLNASSAHRICNDCELIRAHDPLYQRLLHGQLNLCIKAVSGQGLMQCDLVGASDPYIRFSLAGKEYRSRAVQDSLNPVWDDSAEFNLQWHDPSTTGGEKDVQAIFDAGQDSSVASARAAQAGSAAASAALSKSLCIEVWDENAGLIEDTFMGCVYIPVGDLEKNILYEDRFPLRSKRDAAALVTAEERNVLAAGLSAGVDALKGAGGALLGAGGALLNVVSGGAGNSRGKRVTGSIHLQIMLATSGYTAEMLRILPSLEGLGRRPSDLTLAMQQQQQQKHTLPPSSPPQAKKESSSSMPSRSTPPSMSLAHASASAGPISPESHSPASAAIRKELHHFLRSSRLHPLLRRMLDLFLAFNFGYWLDLWREILSYQNPFVSLLAFVAYVCVVWKMPVELIPALVPLALLLHLVANLMSRKVSEGDAILARFAAEDAAESLAKAAALKAEEDAASPLHKFGQGAKAQGIRNFFSKRFGGSTTSGANGAAAGTPKPAPSPTAAAAGSASSPLPAPASLPPRVRTLTGSSPSSSRNSAPSVSRPLGGRTMSAASTSSFPHPLSPMQAEFYDEAEEAQEEGGVATQSLLLPPPQTPLLTGTGASGSSAGGAPGSVTPLLTPRSGGGGALTLPPPLVVGDSPRVSPVPAATPAPTEPAVSVTAPNGATDASASPAATTTDEEHTGSVLLRMRRLKRQVRLVQSMIDSTLDLIEEFLRIWSWTDVDKSQRFVRGCLVVFFLAWYFSPRTLLIAAGVYKWSQHLFKLRRRIKTIRKQMKTKLQGSGAGGSLRKHGLGGAHTHAASQQGVVSFRRPSQLMMQAENKSRHAQAR